VIVWRISLKTLSIGGHKSHCRLCPTREDLRQFRVHAIIQRLSDFPGGEVLIISILLRSSKQSFESIRYMNNVQALTVRNAAPGEFQNIGKLMVQVYSQLEGFPSEAEQPDYYRMLANIGDLTRKPDTELLVATTDNGDVAGAVVYFGDMQHYGSGGVATKEKNSSGFRLLAVDSQVRGLGIGKLLIRECIRKAEVRKHDQVIIHTTLAMQNAWKMYERMGFKRSQDLDFMQGELAVFGFRLPIENIDR